MFFSIIIPIYNTAESLASCLQSVKEQSFSDFEVILVNDGSTDESKEICRTFVSQDDRFIYIEQENKGVSVARNKGIRLAKGKYITFLDSDDVYYTDYLHSFYQLIHFHPNCDNIWCGFQMITADARESGLVVCFSSEDDITLTSRDEIMTLHEKMLDASPINKVYKREILVKYKIQMPENLDYGEDLIFNYRYLDKTNSNIVISNRPQYGYRCFSNESLNHKYRENLKEIYEVLFENIFMYLKKWNVSEFQISKYYSTCFYCYEKIMDNSFHKQCGWSLNQKYRFNNQILRSKGFRQAMEKAECRVHPLFEIAYKSKRYSIVRAVKFLLHIKVLINRF